MKGILTLKDILQSGDWFVKVGLKDAYFTIPIDSDHQQHLRFMLEGKRYQFTCLPFSLRRGSRGFKGRYTIRDILLDRISESGSF